MVAATTAYRTQNAKMGCYQSGPTYRKEPRNSAISRCFWAFNYIYACIKDCVLIDPCCGSGGMFVQSARFVDDHSGNIDDISVYGQDSNPTTWKMAQMNLAIRGIEPDLGTYAADTFLDDRHPTLRADYIMANEAVICGLIPEKARNFKEFAA